MADKDRIEGVDVFQGKREGNFSAIFGLGS
jgi:hypothetical protein